jgi:hypothetical protein
MMAASSIVNMRCAFDVPVLVFFIMPSVFQKSVLGKKYACVSVNTKAFPLLLLILLYSVVLWRYSISPSRVVQLPWRIG